MFYELLFANENLINTLLAKHGFRITTVAIQGKTHSGKKPLSACMCSSYDDKNQKGVTGEDYIIKSVSETDS